MAFFGGVQLDRPWPSPYRRLLGMAMAGLLCVFVALTVFVNSNHLPLAAKSEATTTTTVNAWVLLPNRHIELGEPLTADLFSRQEWQLSELETEQVVGRLAAIDGTYAGQLILKGEPLLRSQVSLVIPAVYEVSTAIPAGFRAISVPINSESGVEGWVKPGVYVDVVWATEQRGKQLVTIIVENSRVLSVGGVSEKMREDQDGTPIRGRVPSARNTKPAAPTNPQAKFATLLVSLEDSQRINLAKNSGTLTLSLRGNSDKEAAGDQTITVDRMMKNRGIVLSDQITGRIRVNGKTFEVRDDGRVKPIESTNLSEPGQQDESLGYYLKKN